MAVRKRICSYGILAVGTFFMAVGTNVVYEPMSMVTGGFAGVGIVLRHFFSVPVWLVTVILNVPLFVTAFYRFGIHFVKKTLFAAVCFSAFLAVIPVFPVKHSDYLMAALMGGGLNGLGLALVFRQGASTGGTDLLAVLLKSAFPAVSSGTVLAILDGLVVVSGMVVFGLRTGLYAIVAVIITTRLMDHILDGFHFSKLLFIISDKPYEISAEIMEKMERGLTALDGVGMYSRREKKVLMCAVSKKEAVFVTDLVKKIDDHAFIILSDAKEVLGEGFDK